MREPRDPGKASWRRRGLAAVGNGGGRVATWSVLFTDMVGSTEMRVRVGEEAFDRVRTDVDTGIGQAITAHDGAAVKSTGDGVLAGFTATEGRLEVLDAETLEHVGRPLPDIDSPAHVIDLDDAGDRLLIQAKDQTVRLADLTSRQFLGGPIDMGDAPESSVPPEELASPYTFGNGSSVLRDDGEAVAIQTDQGTVVWDLDPASLADAACRVAGRNLTRAEWDEHIGALAPYRSCAPTVPNGRAVRGPGGFGYAEVAGWAPRRRTPGRSPVDSSSSRTTTPRLIVAA